MYRNFYGDTWEDFHKDAKGRDVYLFGWNVGKNIYLTIQRYECPWNIVGILDNDKDKQGYRKIPHTDTGVDVISPEELKKIENKDKILVLICGSYISEMAEQLEWLGIKHYYSETWLSAIKGMRYHKHEIEQETINRLTDIMVDSESVEVINKIARKRREGFLDYSDIYTRGSDYFRDEFWLPEHGGVFVDAGAFDGDTIEEYTKWTKGDFKHIYSFEPQKDMIDKIKDKLWVYGNRVSLIEKGLWSKTGTISFDSGDGVFSGKINAEGKDEIETAALDDVINEQVTFIKMDIEGAEVEAIKGARDIICRDRPKMAICIYHKPSDLWEIPFLIHTLVPDYRLSIRHFGVTVSNTVLFAHI